jgi:RNA recognition motif-containing protein
MNIHIANLNPGTSLSELRGCFEKFGAVTEGTISTYRVDGKFKTVGFIEMPSSDHGRAAIVALQDQVLAGCLLKLREG